MQNFYVLILSSIFTLLTVSGCAVAPFSTATTARSLGSGHVEINAGAVGSADASPVVKVGVGLSDSLDLGIEYEMLSLGFFAKYSVLNNQEGGPSVALLGGAGTGPSGSSGPGSYYYVGPVASIKWNDLEPYVVARYNFIHWPSTDLNFGTLGTMSTGTQDYSYFAFTAGLSYWPLSWLGVHAESTNVGKPNSGTAWVWGAGLMFKI